ncbi:aldehyde dehydrogenase family protein, partial [Klebsiella pneumoniae]|uniref:aldehyde dehydrogenase family protein n=1 Tax=Klebsiella pneumoniae TaxID=573 RepID=UPI003631E116
KELTIGPGKGNYDVGPILNEQQFNRIMAYLELAKTEGTVLTGGSRVHIDHFEGAFYIEPTIIDQLSSDSKLAQEEIFGPVLTVFTFKDE